MNRYAAALSLHPTPVEAVGEVAGEILERFDGDRPDLLVCFASPHHVGAFEDIAHAIAGGSREIEDGPALSVFAASFGAGRIDPLVLDALQTDDGFVIVGWPDTVAPRGTLLMLADPYSFPVPEFLRLVNAQVPDVILLTALLSPRDAPDVCRGCREQPRALTPAGLRATP